MPRICCRLSESDSGQIDSRPISESRGATPGAPALGYSWRYDESLHSLEKSRCFKLETPADLLDLHNVLPVNCRLATPLVQFNSVKLCNLVEFPLATLAVASLRKVAAQLGLTALKLQNFALAVERASPRDSSLESQLVVDRFQLMHLLTCEDGSLRHLCRDPVLQLCAIVAALVRSLPRPGRGSSSWQTKHCQLPAKHAPEAASGSRPASVFEKLIEDPQANFLESLSPDIRNRVVDLVDRIVLFTETARHMSDLLKAVPGDEEAATAFRLGFALKLSDMSHNFRAFQVHSKLVECLREEFYRQRGREQELGADGKERFAALSKSQVQFLSVFIEPLARRWSALSGNSTAAAQMLDQLSHNIQTWTMLSGIQQGPRYIDNRVRFRMSALAEERRACLRRARVTSSVLFLALSYGLAGDADDVQRILAEHAAEELRPSGAGASEGPRAPRDRHGGA